MSSYTTHPGTLHRITSPSTPGNPIQPLVAFEHTPNPPDTHLTCQKTLIFLGGLFDGLLTVPFVPSIVSALPPTWSLVEPVLSSSYRQWGFSSLGESEAEISRIIEYFRQQRSQKKIVLLGSSTGCQQVMHYLLSETRLPTVEGAIFQASVSDRELMSMFITQSEYDTACKMAQSYVDEGRCEEILPLSMTKQLFMSAPVSAKRWLSLASPGPLHNGEDDYFSSDFDDQRLEKTFGRLGKSKARLMFLYSDEDQYVPDTVDKAKLVGSWHHHVKKGGGILDEDSGIIEEASHTLEEGGEGEGDLVRKVVAFLKRCESGV
ncbi:hypothetical protein ACLMJK_003168 [Lecanora helva]